MSHLSITLTTQPPADFYAPNSVLSVENHQAKIHLTDPENELAVIQKAGRQLDGLGIMQIQLIGDWQIEQQWALAQSFTTTQKQLHIQWCDDQNKTELINRYECMLFTRNLINATPEDLSPEVLANSCANWLQSLTDHSISYSFCTGEELKKQGWMGIYHVGRGSTRPPVLLELDFNPTNNPNAHVSACLVGKGITFDSGGYSMKSSEGMLSMKCDMGGAATVTGGLGLAILRGLNKRVKLFLCCAENLVSGHAYKLGDVITYKNGTTVEIVNTDAEGRLVLADGLMAASETGAELIIDAATLTGAAQVALGSEYNAFFALDKNLEQRALKYANSEQEPAWALPLEKWHRNKCPSAFADTANSRPQKGGGGGGASNAAGFLSRFVNEDGAGWLHIDLAAAYNPSNTPCLPAGATAQGFRTIAKTLLEENNN
ncbi:aminopeptidase PepB [Paraglaciecola aquimarina]|uniref:Aminopeptidase PepB n=1 Tax=Paraglaciecola algarum TaxID=3050085 RepID=A0ABS9D4T7_9ALTE|nr:aminopeptidase PepB [Paraglaciecola sp. G1-23]MCF2947445.1 aminopeptidase PepB [Paraglaciecola sp. G1-23]